MIIMMGRMGACFAQQWGHGLGTQIQSVVGVASSVLHVHTGGLWQPGVQLQCLLTYQGPWNRAPPALAGTPGADAARC
jgi:hypothetical protein